MAKQTNKAQQGARALTVTPAKCLGMMLPQVRRSRPGSWSAADEQRFLAMLAITSNVALSLRHAGKSVASAYMLRRRSATFRTAWEAALNEGYTRLEAQLLDRALNAGRTSFEIDEVADDEARAALAALPPLTDAQQLALLAQHRRGVATIRAASSSVEDADRARAQIAARIARLARAAGKP